MTILYNGKQGGKTLQTMYCAKAGMHTPIWLRSALLCVYTTLFRGSMLLVFRPVPRLKNQEHITRLVISLYVMYFDRVCLLR